MSRPRRGKAGVIATFAGRLAVSAFAALTQLFSPVATAFGLIGMGAVPALALTPPIASAQEPVQSTADRSAEAVLKRMTFEERLNLLRGSNPFILRSQLSKDVPMGAGYVRGVPRLGVPALVESDASLGVANMMGLLRPGDVATALPSGAAMAASWDPDLAERAGAMIGDEAREKGFNVLLAGGVNLVREPRGGRNFEYLGEDPLLAGVLAGRSIRGIQSNHIISTVKHFALNAQETGRTALSSNMGEGALRESDLLAFEIAIEIGQPGSVMCAYNQVNGVYSCENSFLLNDVLRRDWGYKGFVMSDWGAVHSVSIRQGLDQESGTMPNQGFFGSRLRDALAGGAATETDVDRSAFRILRTMYSLGLVDHPPAPAPIDFEAHGRVAQAVAEAGMVLLKNDGDLLPIAASARRILVVGDHADVGVLSGGGGSSQVNPVGGAALVAPAAFGKRLYARSSPLQALRERLPDATITFDDGTDVQRAAAAARGSDLVLVFAEQFTTESLDVPDLNLPDNQDRLIAAVAEANPKTAVILETGGPVLMPWLDKVGAVLEAWYPGQRGGQAIARVLDGDVNPSGRLPVTFPATIDQTPNPKLTGFDLLGKAVQHDLYRSPQDPPPFVVSYPESADAGYRWYVRTHAKPLFAFGHGLSYTRFTYKDLRLTGGSALRVSFALSNVGPRAGVEVAQVYARVGAVKRLIGWSRVSLEQGETRRVTVTAEPRILASFHEASRNWHIVAGDYAIEVGAAADQPMLTATTHLVERSIQP